MQRASDWQTFAVAMVILLGSFYGLLFASGVEGDVRLACAGFVGAVSSYFLARQSGTTAAINVAREMNGHGGNSKPTEVHAETAVITGRGTTIEESPKP